MDSWILFVQNKNFRRRKRAFKSSWSRRGNQKLLVRTIIGIWKILSISIMESSNLNISSIRDNLHCWMSRTTSERRNFSSIATLGMRNVHDLLAEGKTPYERRFGEHSKRTNSSLWSNCWISSGFTMISVKTSLQFGKKVLVHIFLGYELIAKGTWEGDIPIADLEDLEKLDASEKSSSKNQRERSIDITKGDEFIFPVTGGTVNLSVRDYDFREPTTKAGTNRKVRRFQWRLSRLMRRVSTDRINRWRWSPCPVLDDSRWFHSSSSQWTSSSTLGAEGRNISYSTGIHWCHKVYLHWSGRHARETCRWLLECRFEQKLVRFVSRFHEVHSIQRKTSQGTCVVRGGDWQTTTRLEKREAKTRQCSTTERNFLLLISMTTDYKETAKMRGENWKNLWQQPCRANRKARIDTTKVAAKEETASQKMSKKNDFWLWKVESHESTRQRVESSLLIEHEDRIAGKGFTSMTGALARVSMWHQFQWPNKWHQYRLHLLQHRHQWWSAWLQHLLSSMQHHLQWPTTWHLHLLTPVPQQRQWTHMWRLHLWPCTLHHHRQRPVVLSALTPHFLVNPQFSIPAVEASASQVVGSFPSVDESASPVYNQVHQETDRCRARECGSVCSSTPLNKLCTCPSRSRLWKASKWSLGNSSLCGLRSRSWTFLLLRLWRW